MCWCGAIWTAGLCDQLPRSQGHKRVNKKVKGRPVNIQLGVSACWHQHAIWKATIGCLRDCIGLVYLTRRQCQARGYSWTNQMRTWNTCVMPRGNRGEGAVGYWLSTDWDQSWSATYHQRLTGWCCRPMEFQHILVSGLTMCWLSDDVANGNVPRSSKGLIGCWRGLIANCHVLRDMLTGR